MKKAIIDLQKFRTLGADVFIGRPRGKEVRKESKIDSIEPEFERIEIIIPNDIASINPSFLEEFLENVVKRLGPIHFREKFHFNNPGEYKIDDDLEDAIDRILRDVNALA